MTPPLRLQAAAPNDAHRDPSYDADGNVLTRRTRAGQTIPFAYDMLNRLATRRSRRLRPMMPIAEKPSSWTSGRRW